MRKPIRQGLMACIELFCIEQEGQRRFEFRRGDFVGEHPVKGAHHKIGDVGVNRLELLKALKSSVV